MRWQVEVAFSGTDDKGDVKSINTSTPMKVLPPWMIKQGMNLTKEQRGETSQELKMGGSSVALEIIDDKKSAALDEDKKNIQVFFLFNHSVGYENCSLSLSISLLSSDYSLSCFWCFIG